MNCLLENSKDINKSVDFPLLLIVKIEALYIHTRTFLFCFTGVEGYEISGVSTSLPSFKDHHMHRRFIKSHALGMSYIYSVLYHYISACTLYPRLTFILPASFFHYVTFLAYYR